MRLIYPDPTFPSLKGDGDKSSEKRQEAEEAC